MVREVTLPRSGRMRWQADSLDESNIHNEQKKGTPQNTDWVIPFTSSRTKAKPGYGDRSQKSGYPELPWWSSGSGFTLTMPGARVRSLVRELDPTC